MKRIAFLAAVTSLVVSCDNATNPQNAETSADTIVSSSDANPQTTQEEATFNIQDIQISTADIGDFPFIGLPKGLREMNKPLVREFDVCFFPINGVMTPFEGKLYKTNVSAERGEEFSQHFFEKSMAEYLQSVGAVKVFDGEITKEEYDRYNKQDPNKGDEGDIGYAGQNIKFWVLRTKDKGNIYIQYNAYNAAAALNIVQEAAFEQTITKVTAEDIIQDLSKNGKSILYINFDVDKSNLSEQGQEVAQSIAEALTKDLALKISIDGHTDNTGETAHNKKLSQGRAEAVMNYLISKDIDKSRLSANGFGAEQPLVANDSEENKSKNRRVELVRIK